MCGVSMSADSTRLMRPLQKTWLDGWTDGGVLRLGLVAGRGWKGQALWRQVEGWGKVCMGRVLGFLTRGGAMVTDGAWGPGLYRHVGGWN